MEPPFSSDVHVSPIFSNAIRSLPAPAISGNNFNLVIGIVVTHTYYSGESTIEEYNWGVTGTYRYESLSWETIDRMLLETDFPYSLERIKWNPTEQILENKDDLIKQILDFAHDKVQNVKPPFQDDDTVHMSLIFVKEVFLSPQEFELTQARIVATQYEYFAEILSREINDKIKGLGQGSSFYEELQWLECYIEKRVRETSYSRMYIDENYEKKLLQVLIERAREEFRSLPAVRSTMQFIEKAILTNHDLEDLCSICMEGYLPASEAYSMPCRHNFHFDCIEMWLLRNPSCPMCRCTLQQMESK